MDEIELRKLPLNDEFSQCMRKLRVYPSDIVEARKEEMRKCNHLFVLLKKGEEIYGCNSTDYYNDANEVECVHCGLTNRFNRIESILDSEYIECSKSFRGMLASSTRYNRKTLESEMFEKIYDYLYFRGGKSFKNSSLNLISNECLLTSHPGLLYRLALKINPIASEEEILAIMKTLNFLESSQERIRLQSDEHAEALIRKYYISKPKSLVKKYNK